MAATSHALVAALLVVAAACAPADSDYFGRNEPTWVRVPATLGDRVYVGVALLRARQGDTIELESLAVSGLQGDAAVEGLVSILRGETTWPGAITETAADDIDLTQYVALHGVRFDEADGPVALAVRVTGSAPIQGFDGITLRFRVEGRSGVIEDRFPFRASICTGSTFEAAVAQCRPIEEEMRSSGP